MFVGGTEFQLLPHSLLPNLRIKNEVQDLTAPWEFQHECGEAVELSFG